MLDNFSINEEQEYALIDKWKRTLDLVYQVLQEQVRELLTDREVSQKLRGVIALGLRATRTSQAIRMLAGSRLTEDLCALTRILIENIITACYLQIAPESEFKAFRFFFLISELKHQARYEEQFGPLDFLTDEIRATLAAAKARAVSETNRSPKSQTWTSVSVIERAELVDQHLKTTIFVDVTTTAYVKGHAFVHPTQESIEHLLAALSGTPEEAEITSEIAIMLHSCALILFGYALFLNAEFSLSARPQLVEIMNSLR